MVDDHGDGVNQEDDVTNADMFVIRLGDDDEVPFAVCQRIHTVEGTTMLPGSGKTVAEFVAEQALLAAPLPLGDQQGVRGFVAQIASGNNFRGGGNQD